jgi:hypothetical protein
MSDLILYTTEDGRSRIKLRAQERTVWLSQRDMAQLFDVSTDYVGLHLKNIFKGGQLSPKATTEESSVVAAAGILVVKQCLTTRSRLAADRTVKESLTVQAGFNRAASNEKRSVVQKERA